MADYTNKRGIFSLLDVRERQNAGNWSTRGDVWLSPSPFMGPSSVPIGFANGYFSGGRQPSNSPSFPSTVYYSTVARLDYSSDTTTVPARASLPHTKSSTAGFGNQNFGYNVGGYVGGSGLGSSVVDRIDYSNDSSSPSPKGNLAFDDLNSLLGTGNESFGYAAGGYGYDPSVGPIYRTTIQRIDYSSDTSTAAQKGNLATNARDSSGTGNQSFGYYAGGTTHPFARISTVQRVDYSNDTATAAVKGPLSDAHRREIGAAGNADFGYFMGGYNAIPGSNTWVTIVDRVDYSNDTATASPKGPLSQSRSHTCGTGDQSFGYVGGGEGNNNENMSSLERVDYSNDTATSVVRGPLIYSLRDSAASSSKQNANPVQSLQPASSVRTGEIAPQGTDFGYFAGGKHPIDDQLSVVDRIDYSNDTATASPKGNITRVCERSAGAGNALFGYLGGGSPGDDSVSTVDRIDYANDTATASPRGPLSFRKSAHGGSGNKDFGYFGGGNPGVRSTVDRVDYSNDTATAVLKGNLSVAKQFLSAAGNQDFGYFGAGKDPSSSPVSTVDRIDYSNDTATASPKGPLSAVRYGAAATGNASFGYFGGGSNPSGESFFSTIDRIDYSNDTATASAKGPLSAGRRYMLASATTSTTHFYFAGGSSPSDVSTVDRIDYANDTATASPKGPLSTAKNRVTGVSSRANATPLKGPGILEVPVSFGAFSVTGPTSVGTDFGYFGGGSPSKTTVDRVDYSNDTATAAVKGPLSGPAPGLSATGNQDFGYFGGRNPAASRMDRIDYSNDTATASPKGPLSSARRYLGSTGTSSFGYFGGGRLGPAGGSAYVTTVDRVDYANDTATAVAKGPLSVGRRFVAATGNTDFGYFGGGGNPAVAQYSVVDRIDYSNDTAAASPKGVLGQQKHSHGATGNADFGYFGGGLNHLGSVTSSIFRIDYSNDTATAASKGPLGATRKELTATGNTSFGYFGGGAPGPAKSTVERVDYSNDTATAASKGPLSLARNMLAAASPRANALPLKEVRTVNYPKGTYGTPNTGYFAGGYAPSYSSSVDRIDYANDDAALVTKGPLVNPIADNAAGLSSKDFGYFAGGRPSPSIASISSIQRIDYFNDTATALVRGNMTANSKDFSGTNTADFGYLFKGSLPTVERLDYSNDTATTLAKAPLPNNVSYNQTAGNQDFGYGLGHPGSGSKVSRIDYSNDTATALERGLLATQTGEATASGNAEFGYVFGGIYGGSRLSTTQRVDYANDTATGVTKGPMTVARQSLASTGDTSFGYMSGGKPGPLSTVDRIDYSNDTATASPKGPLSATRYLHARASARSDALSVIGPSVVSNAAAMSVINPTKVGYYIAGRRNPGQSGTTDVERIDYSNDTATALVRGPLSITLLGTAATANNFFGYVVGGNIPGAPYYTSSVQRIQFTNDGATPLIRGQLTGLKTNLLAAGNSNFGYFGGGSDGQSPYSNSDVDRVDYSNDTATAVEKGSLNLDRNGGTATGNQNFGYFAGGYGGQPNYDKHSTVDRIDYGNDTATASPKGPLTSIRYNFAATGNSFFGYFGGGVMGLPFPVSRVDRIDYSNDTATASPKGPLSQGDYGTSNLAATGNASFGYFGGGYVWPTARSIVDRIDYSNDTATASLRGPLVNTKQLATASSGAAYGLPQ